jgi:hypothetical protein
MSQPTNSPITACPECGAPAVNGMNCWEQLGGIIAWEYDDPELMAEHFLTVAGYNLQHPAQFTGEAIAGLRTAFIEQLDKGTDVSYIRRRNAEAYGGEKRVLKPESERHPVLRHWKMTIADVFLPDQPLGAAGRVRAWAAAIRSQL